eukprot:TRINITY_DN28543_c0_g1_i1.p1 TRINITY_DN28543_c0_g1~~TRINITY_DN28543_c0_g1_i1.p1  ORF type:complete len:558 (-),score=93.12 TRINITY_DN28543_c0_g1_i1:131-1744(-)
MHIFVAFVVFAAACLCSSAITTDAVARTSLGVLVGEDDGQVRVWRGIRYAEPPKRFEVAAPKQPWTGNLSAKDFGAACLFDVRARGKHSFSEDCLFANVWAPSRLDQPVPVVVFIHGGGFLMGSGSDARLWGDVFVTDPSTPVVYVTLNYRMGIFGFYSGESGSNFGIQDQQLALKFVQENIAAFGGKADDITLVGQSAGAMSVQVHLVAPASRGLFQRAYLASTVGLHFRSMEENEPFVKSAAKAVGCLGWFRNRTRCMQKRPALALDAAAVTSGFLFHLHTDCEDCDNLLPWLPVVDGVVIPRSPLDMLRDGEHAKVPVVVSTVRNESWSFLPSILHNITDKEKGYDLAMKALFRDHWQIVRDHYANSTDSAHMNSTSKLGLAVSDALFTCYGRFVARALAQASPTFLSTFMHAPSAQADPGNAAVDAACEHGVTCHASDLNWLFPNSPAMANVTKTRYTDSELVLAKKYSAALRSFAYGDYSKWLPYSELFDISFLWGDEGFHITRGYHKEHCDLFDKLGYAREARSKDVAFVI